MNYSIAGAREKRPFMKTYFIHCTECGEYPVLPQPTQEVLAAKTDTTGAVLCFTGYCPACRPNSQGMGTLYALRRRASWLKRMARAFRGRVMGWRSCVSQNGAR